MHFFQSFHGTLKVSCPDCPDKRIINIDPQGEHRLPIIKGTCWGLLVVTFGHLVPALRKFLNVTNQIIKSSMIFPEPLLWFGGTNEQSQKLTIQEKDISKLFGKVPSLTTQMMLGKIGEYR